MIGPRPRRAFYTGNCTTQQREYAVGQDGGWTNDHRTSTPTPPAAGGQLCRRDHGAFAMAEQTRRYVMQILLRAGGITFALSKQGWAVLFFYL